MQQHRFAPLAALALLIACEGTSAAKTQAPSLQSHHDASAAAASANTSVSSTSGVETSKPEAATFAANRVLVNSELAARIRICHISHHPLDGVPAEEHACPLFIAEVSVAPVGNRVD